MTRVTPLVLQIVKDNELGALKQGLNGEYVEPGPGGDPIRNPKVLLEHSDPAETHGLASHFLGRLAGQFAMTQLSFRVPAEPVSMTTACICNQTPACQTYGFYRLQASMPVVWCCARPRARPPTGKRFVVAQRM